MVLLALLTGCQGPADTLDSRCDTLPGGGGGENVLVILTDDIGIDNTAGYGAHPDPPPTPAIDELISQGLRFRNAYAAPTCSPSRAALLTGRMPSRTGIGSWIHARTDSVQLAPDELTIPEVLALSPHDYARVLVGKWHLSSFDQEDPLHHPLEQGFDCAAGTLGNPLDAWQDSVGATGYRGWEEVVDGVPAWQDTYLLSRTTDQALARLARTREPWFMLVAYNGAHEPVHVPPAALQGQGVGSDATDTEKYRAMVEATDAEIGRLLGGLSPELRARTTIVYASDNGSPQHGIVPPFNPERHKGSVYEGGVRVPLVVVGPRVAASGGESLALVHLVDLLPTVAALAEVDLDAALAERGVVVDGHSLLPLLEDPGSPGPHRTLYTEGYWDNEPLPADRHLRMLRDEAWKLVRSEGEGEVEEELYRLDLEAWEEGEDLLAAEVLDSDAALAADRLRAELDAAVAALEGAVPARSAPW